MKKPTVGIGYRRAYRDALLERESEIQSLEVLVEHFMPLTSSKTAELEAIAERFRVVLHGVSLSLGSIERPSSAYWRDLRSIGRITGAPYLGEHLSISRSGGYDIWHLSPVWRTRESLDTCLRNVDEVRSRTDLDFVVENITEQVSYGPQEFSPGEFLIRLCEQSGSGFLFDIANLEINVANNVPGHELDDIEYLARVPWVQMHVAGGSAEPDGYRIDSHSEPVESTTLNTLRRALRMQRPDTIVIEKDSNLDDFESLLQDVSAVRQVVEEAVGVGRD